MEIYIREQKTSNGNNVKFVEKKSFHNKHDAQPEIS